MPAKVSYMNEHRSAGWGIQVRRSDLTKHWIVNPGTTTAEGFRKWVDAMAEANRRADKHRAYCRRAAVA